MFINLSGYSPTDTSFPLVRVDEQFFTDVCLQTGRNGQTNFGFPHRIFMRITPTLSFIQFNTVILVISTRYMKKKALTQQDRVDFFLQYRHTFSLNMD